MPSNDRKPITLTFDNGPDPDATPAVLDVLARRGVQATFFVIGNRLAQYRAYAERARAEGHWIGNHTWSHSIPFREKGQPEFVSEEIGRAQEAMGDLAHPDRLFRPFGAGRLEGALTSAAARYLTQGDFTCVLWNAVPGDWKNHDGWPEVALAQIEGRDWPLVVLHDINLRAMQHLDGFIGTLLDRGYEFRQAFPDDCIAVYRGHATPVLSEGVLAD